MTHNNVLSNPLQLTVNNPWSKPVDFIGALTSNFYPRRCSNMESCCANVSPTRPILPRSPIRGVTVGIPPVGLGRQNRLATPIHLLAEDKY